MPNVLNGKDFLLLHAFIEKTFSSNCSEHLKADLYHSITENWAELLTISQDKILYNPPDERESLWVRISALEFAVLSILTDSNSDTEHFTYYTLFQTISNTILSVIDLADNGFDYPAMVLIRNLYEQFMTLLIITESPKKRAEFIAAKDNESARKVWHQHFSKKNFLRMLETYLKNDAACCQDYLSWAEQLYKHLSSFIHNDFAYLATLSMSQPDPTGLCHPNLWDEYVSRRKSICSVLFSTVFFSQFVFSCMLYERQTDITFDWF